MAPTKTAILCVGGRVGRYFDKRWVGQSPERAGAHSKGLAKRGKREKRRERNILILTVLGGRWSTTGFCDCRSKGVKERGREKYLL